MPEGSQDPNSAGEGSPQPHLPPPYPDSGGANAAAPRARSNGMATASLVLGIVALPTSCLSWLIGLPLAILALVLGLVAMKQIRERGQGGRGTALTGVILGIVVLALSVVLFAIVGGSMFWMNSTQP